MRSSSPGDMVFARRRLMSRSIVQVSARTEQIPIGGYHHEALQRAELASAKRPKRVGSPPTEVSRRSREEQELEVLRAHLKRLLKERQHRFSTLATDDTYAEALRSQHRDDALSKGPRRRWGAFRESEGSLQVKQNSRDVKRMVVHIDPTLNRAP